MKTPPKGDNKFRYNTWVYFSSILSFFVDLKFPKFSQSQNEKGYANLG